MLDSLLRYARVGQQKRISAVSINPPLLPGSYPHRSEDCERAIERDFLRETVNLTTPFVDLDRVLSAIAEDATRAGWNEDEVTDAVIRLAERYRMKPANR